jgi:hypothetical protein
LRNENDRRGRGEKSARLRLEINHVDKRRDNRAEDGGKKYHAANDLGVAALLPFLSARENNPPEQGKTFFKKKIHAF